jgi:hypothetical protein
MYTSDVHLVFNFHSYAQRQTDGKWNNKKNQCKIKITYLSLQPNTVKVEEDWHWLYIGVIIDWCLTSIPAICQLYRGVNRCKNTN